MVELFYTYEKYAVEILGIAFVVLLIMQCVQMLRIHRLKKQWTQMVERQQLKDEMERMGQTGYGGRNPVASGGIIREDLSEEPDQSEKRMQAAGVKKSAKDESQLISDVLGEIFP